MKQATLPAYDDRCFYCLCNASRPYTSQPCQLVAPSCLKGEHQEKSTPAHYKPLSLLPTSHKHIDESHDDIMEEEEEEEEGTIDQDDEQGTPKGQSSFWGNHDQRV